jgi:hypothetical protein
MGKGFARGTPFLRTETVVAVFGWEEFFPSLKKAR